MGNPYQIVITSATTQPINVNSILICIAVKRFAPGSKPPDRIKKMRGRQLAGKTANGAINPCATSFLVDSLNVYMALTVDR